MIPNYDKEDVEHWNDFWVIHEYQYLSSITDFRSEFEIVRAEGIKRGLINPATYQIES